MRKYRKSTKIDRKSLRRCFAHKQHKESPIFSFMDATWRRFWSPFQGQLDVPGPSKSPVQGQLAVQGPSNPSFQGHPDIPRSSEPQFQGQLDVTGCSKPPFQDQLDVPGSLKPPSQGHLTCKGSRNRTNFCKCSAKLLARKRSMSLKQSSDECNQKRDKLLQVQLKDQGNTTLNVLKHGWTSADATNQSRQQNQCP